MMTALTNEILKLRTIRSPWLLLAVAQAIIIAGISAMMTGADPKQATTANMALGTPAGMASLFTLVLGITAIAGEYRHKTITDTYLATPRRGRVIAAKLAVYTGAGMTFGIVNAATALVTTAIWYAARGASLNLANTEVWRNIAGGIAWNAAFAAIGVGVGALVRNLGAAISAALLWIALIEGIASQLLGSLGRWLPFASGQALDNMSSTNTALSQWVAGLVLLAYAAAFATLATSTTIRRDVT
jgi:ABC-2 type transport system permease protein